MNVLSKYTRLGLCLQEVLQLQRAWVSNSIEPYSIRYNVLDGALAEQLRSGLQNRVDGCNSRTCLHVIRLQVSSSVLQSATTWT